MIEKFGLEFVSEMNQLMARSAMRSLIGGVRRFDQTAVVRDGFSGGERWWRMMSTVAEKAVAPEKKDREESTAVPEKKERGEVVTSSYWGISRPKITREDGTEWPWNCFMVIFIYIIFDLIVVKFVETFHILCVSSLCLCLQFAVCL